MMAENERDRDDALDPFFEAAREARPEPSDALMARILADAAEAAPRPAEQLRPAEKPSLVASVLDAIGGWPSFAGLATATVAGVWIGFASPDTLSTLTLAETGFDLADVLPGTTELVFEEG